MPFGPTLRFGPTARFGPSVRFGPSAQVIGRHVPVSLRADNIAPIATATDTGAMNEGEARPGHQPNSMHGHQSHGPQSPGHQSHRHQSHGHQDHGHQGHDDPTKANHSSDADLAGLTPLEFWEARYFGEERVWSGKVNISLADAVAELAPGASIDLGCGEGADVLWLAEHGWQATGLDISPTAISRATQEAAARGLSAERANFVVADLATWRAEKGYDLVSASFLHSPVPLAREEILASAAAAVRPGGHLLVISHAAPADPQEVAHPHADLHHSPEDEYRSLNLDPAEWTLAKAGRRNRTGRKPTGEPVEVEDLIVLVRRGD